jgi:hypothetical protein
MTCIYLLEWNIWGQTMQNIQLRAEITFPAIKYNAKIWWTCLRATQLLDSIAHFPLINMRPPAVCTLEIEELIRYVPEPCDQVIVALASLELNMMHVSVAMGGIRNMFSVSISTSCSWKMPYGFHSRKLTKLREHGYGVSVVWTQARSHEHEH